MNSGVLDLDLVQVRLAVVETEGSYDHESEGVTLFVDDRPAVGVSDCVVADVRVADPDEDDVNDAVPSILLEAEGVRADLLFVLRSVGVEVAEVSIDAERDFVGETEAE